LLERSIHDAVVDGLVNYVSQIKMGNPLDPDVLFGPLADAEQLKKVMQYVEYGKQDGNYMVVSDSIRMAQMAKATTPADHLHECEQ